MVILATAAVVNAPDTIFVVETPSSVIVAQVMQVRCLYHLTLHTCAFENSLKLSRCDTLQVVANAEVWMPVLDGWGVIS